MKLPVLTRYARAGPVRVVRATCYYAYYVVSLLTLRLTGTIVALAGARAELKFRSENSNAFSPGDQKMSTSEAPPEAGRRTPATQLQLSN